MSEGKHTPRWVSEDQIGPPKRCHVAQVFGGDGEPLAFLDPTDPPSIASDRARLFAAAPELLDATKQAYEQMLHLYGKVGLTNLLRDVIDKAEGRDE